MRAVSDESPNHETVAVSRLTVATAIDLLRDFEDEFERVNATGPYLDELSETIEQLEESLDNR